MKGFVDDQLRALLQVEISAGAHARKAGVAVWVDTAFNGGLALPRESIEELGLKEDSSTVAVLADGEIVVLPTFLGFLEWFGSEYRTQVIATDGANGLLGTMLLDQRDLSVSYKRRTVSLR